VVRQGGEDARADGEVQIWIESTSYDTINIMCSTSGLFTFFFNKLANDQH
jgi:hypothetical protein